MIICVGLMTGESLTVKNISNVNGDVVIELPTAEGKCTLYFGEYDISYVMYIFAKGDAEPTNELVWEKGVVTSEEECLEVLVADNPFSVDRMFLRVEDDEERVIISTWRNLVDVFVERNAE